MAEQSAALHPRFTVDPQDAHAWNLLREQWFADYPFENDTQRQTIQRVAEADWLFRQEQRRYDEAEASLIREHGDPLRWSNDQHKRLQLWERRLDRAEQSFLKWQRIAEQLRRTRFTETLRVEAHQWRREAHQAAQAARLRAAAEAEAENRPPPSPFDLYLRRPQHRVQYIEASIKNGVTVTTFSPPTQNLLDVFLKSAQPHELVERTFRLLAPFPPEYHWFQTGSDNPEERVWVWRTPVGKCCDDFQHELAEGQGHLLESPNMQLPKEKANVPENS